ncbi:MAG: hypothetical protein HOZ81_52240 [Streptomyces sp.]|nr:hypothetical protein [Streptomyces sp.]
MSAPTTGEERTLSAECTLATKPGYEDLHHQCRQITDVPLPHSNGLLLIRRCGYGCHRSGGDQA